MKNLRKKFVAKVPKAWRIVVYIVAALAVLLAILAIIFVIWRANYRAENAAARAEAVKPDSELIGARFVVPRDGEDGVKVNLYIPQHDKNEDLPVIFNIHGGGFVGNDADSLDTQSERYSDNWHAIVVTINFTKPDVKSIDYGVDEIVDTVLYFDDNAKVFNADSDRFSVIGYSSGGFYAAKAAEQLDADGFKLAGQILNAPYVYGLPDDVESTVAPAFFVLGTDDPISQSSGPYQETLRDAGVDVTVNEYEGGLHPFIESINPEFQNSTDDDQYVTQHQQELAVQAETDIDEWLQEQYRQR